MAVEFYKQVPKSLAANLRYRVALRKRAEHDEEFQQAMITACRHDVLFFFNAWCWLYEPRPRLSKAGVRLPNQIPFITWEHQDPAILEIRKHLGFEDIGVEKSRGEGGSWIAVLLALQDWLFEPMSSIGFVSRNENAVDNPDDPDSLMWKLDWELTKLPVWMRPTLGPGHRNLTKHTFTNLDNLSVITGYAATGDVGSGGRKKWFLKDELSKFPRPQDAESMASTQQVTESRLIIGTPKGSEGEYFRVMHEPSNMVKVTLDWKNNPSRNRGLYEFRDGKPVAIDPVNNPLPDGYYEKNKDLFSRLRRKGFKLEGKQRSPWYDHECDRPGATPQNIAQELDRDYGGSMYRIFGHDFFKAAEAKVRQPFVRGTLRYDREHFKPTFDSSDDGQFLLWTQLNAKNQPPAHQYAVAADIGSGLGGAYTSNSVLEVIDLLTNEQVMEYATNTVEPGVFGEIAVAVCNWFHGAYLSWEANYGGGFMKRVKDIGYANVYYRLDFTKRGRVKTKDLGWWTDDTTKQMMFSDMTQAVIAEDLIVHSDLLVKEFGQYVMIGTKIAHVMEKHGDDSNKGKAHGDRVMAMGVALQAAKDRPLMSSALKDHLSDNPPPRTMEARQKEYEDSLKGEDDVWDDRESADLARAGQAYCLGRSR